MKTARHLLLSEPPNNARLIRVLSSLPSTPDHAGQQSWVTVTRSGTFTDPRYGAFAITLDMLHNMVRQFDARAVGTDIFLDVSHEPDKGAAAKILRLSVEGARLRALVEWTAYGVQAVRDKGFRYLSAEYHENWQGNEVGVNDRPHGAVLLGAGLTVRPVIKGLDPITLSCATDGDVPTWVHPELAEKLLNESKSIMNYLEKLLAKIGALTLSETTRTSLIQLAKAQLSDVSDVAKAKTLAESIEASAQAMSDDYVKTLSTPPVAPSTPSTQVQQGATASVSEVRTLSEQDVTQLVQKQLAQVKQDAEQSAATLAAKQKLLSDIIGAAQGLDDGLKKELSESANRFISVDMTDDKVRELAQVQIEQGNKIVAARTLSTMGYGHAPVGSPRIEVVNDDVKVLSQIYVDHLARTSAGRKMPLDSKKAVDPFVAIVLSQYDQVNAQALASERKMLAAGSGTMDTASGQFPAGVMREVIRQSLSDLSVLSLVQTLTDFSAQSTTLIPYELRDTSQIVNQGMVYESQPIPFAGISQNMEMSYVNQMKIAMSVTNEIMHFSRTAQINWDAVARNIESNARILRELVVLRLTNEIQRASDSYGAVNVASESFAAQLTGAKNTIKTALFPIVAPYQPRDLKGNPVGVSENPITVILNSTVIQPFDGSGKQSTGTYYRVTSFNVGLIQFVNQLGAPVTPSNTGTNTISYSRAANVILWDADPAAGVQYKDHLNSLIMAVGSAKAKMKATRFVLPNYALMSSVMNDELSNATDFIAAQKRNGSDTNGEGELVRVKGIDPFATDVPGCHLGDERIILGQRGVTGYVVVKPYAMGEMTEKLDPATGRPVGEKVSYGEEYNSIYTPKAVRDRSMSIVKFSSIARAAI